MALLTNVELTITAALIIVLAIKLTDDWLLKAHRDPTEEVGPYFQAAHDLAGLVIIWLIRSFAFNIYRVPSGSLEPTVDTGDFLLVNQYIYGVKLPVFHNELIPFGKPARGDIALFYYPNDPNLIFVKRVIGIPGDHIKYKNKMLSINGKLVPQKDLGFITLMIMAKKKPSNNLKKHSTDITIKSYNLIHRTIVRLILSYLNINIS